MSEPTTTPAPVPDPSPLPARKALNMARRNKLAAEIVDGFFARLDKYQAAMIGDVGHKTFLRQAIENGMRDYCEFVFHANKEASKT